MKQLKMMENMKYKVGDKVRIKSLDWYNQNKNYETGNVYLSMSFVANMSQYCGQVATIIQASGRNEYKITLDNGYYIWSDEMFEGLVEEETKSNIIEEATAQCDIINDTYICPEGYVFKDENGNVINTTKIVLEKKNRYPKTYEECCKVLDWNHRDYDRVGYESELLCKFQVLLLCRDAYWKIAGEEMGLGRSWKPSDSDYITERYCIFVHRGNILCDTPAQDCFLTFPTEEMRDAFCENFKELIEICKELL